MKYASIYQDLEYDSQKPIIKVLFETDFTKEIRIAMHEGTMMKEHKTSFPIVVEVLEGKIDFGIQQEIKQLSKGDLVALDSRVPHDLKATENSIIRLTLTKYDTTSRVEKVAET